MKTVKQQCIKQFFSTDEKELNHYCALSYTAESKTHHSHGSLNTYFLWLNGNHKMKRITLKEFYANLFKLQQNSVFQKDRHSNPNCNSQKPTPSPSFSSRNPSVHHFSFSCTWIYNFTENNSHFPIRLLMLVAWKYLQKP